MSGIDLVREMNERRPALRCLMHSGHGEASYVDQALQAGAWGYVLKGNPDELLTAIRHVICGEKYLSRILTDKRGSS
jgi:DNA-binding NarL/FixJ family response regulator